MKLRDIGLGAVGCNDKKVESLYDPNTFPKADTVFYDKIEITIGDTSHFYTTEFRNCLEIKRELYEVNLDNDTNLITRTVWFYDDKRMETKREDSQYDLNEMGMKVVSKEYIVDYEANHSVDLIVTSPGYEK